MKKLLLFLMLITTLGCESPSGDISREMMSIADKICKQLPPYKEFKQLYIYKDTSLVICWGGQEITIQNIKK